MSRWVEELYDDDFQVVLQEHELVFVDFYADWCGPCKAVAPVVERVAKEYADRVVFAKLNTDGNPETASRYGVRSSPTLMLFRQGRPVVRLGGFQPDPVLRIALDRYVPAPGSSERPAGPARGGLLSRIFGRG